MSGIIAQNTLDNSGLIKSPAGGGAWNFIKKLTASGDADLSFVDGTDDVVLDSTYKEIVFTFVNIHPSNDGKNFSFQGSTDGGSSYGVTMTSTAYQTYHDESDTDYGLSYRINSDNDNDTDYPDLTQESSADNDHGVCGYLHCYGLSSTTYVKHWMCRFSTVHKQDYVNGFYSAGYFNSAASAIDAIQFKFNANNIDAGDICLYGISS